MTCDNLVYCLAPQAPQAPSPPTRHDLTECVWLCAWYNTNCTIWCTNLPSTINTNHHLLSKLKPTKTKQFLIYKLEPIVTIKLDQRTGPDVDQLFRSLSSSWATSGIEITQPFTILTSSLLYLHCEHSWLFTWDEIPITMTIITIIFLGPGWLTLTDTEE